MEKEKKTTDVALSTKDKLESNVPPFTKKIVGLILFSFFVAGKATYKSPCQSVCLSVCLSVGRSYHTLLFFCVFELFGGRKVQI